MLLGVLNLDWPYAAQAPTISAEAQGNIGVNIYNT